jgi:methylmalonyl-CoA/ethylmalonyl-CoA epimerase
MLRRIDHIALLVPDLEQAMALYREHFGVTFNGRERNEEQGFEVASFAAGDGHIELLAPVRPDSFLAAALQKRGPGIHHIAFEVEDLDECFAEGDLSGLRFTRDRAQRGTGGSRIAFVHPKSLLGVLLELVDLPKNTPGPEGAVGQAEAEGGNEDATAR